MVFRVTVKEQTVGTRDFRALREALKERGIDYRVDTFAFVGVKFEADKKLLKELGLWDQEYEPSLYI
jgi:hypothetical protein